MSRLAYRLSTGWVTEDKRTGLGDGLETGWALFFDLAAAENRMEQFIAAAFGSADRGSYWVHDYADIVEIDADGEMIGQPVRQWRSKPAAEVAS